MSQNLSAGLAVCFAAYSGAAFGASASTCGKVPYSIELKDVGGEVRASLWDGALKSIQRKTDGGITAVAGGALVRTAYAGTMNQSLLQLMKFYSCRLRYQVEVDVTDPVAKAAALEQVRNAQAVMTDRLSEMLDPDVLISLPEKQKQREALRKVTRLPSDPVIDVKLFDKALADITDDMFTSAEMVQIYGSVDLPGVAAIGACGGALKDVVAATTGPIQIALSDLRANYRFLIDGSESGPRMAFQNIFNHAVTGGIAAVPPRDYTSIFKNCSAVETGIKQVLSKAVAASASAKSSAPPDASTAEKIPVSEPDSAANAAVVQPAAPLAGHE